MTDASATAVTTKFAKVTPLPLFSINKIVHVKMEKINNSDKIFYLIKRIPNK